MTVSEAIDIKQFLIGMLTEQSFILGRQLGELESRLIQHIKVASGQLEERLTMRISELDKRLTGKIGELSTSLNTLDIKINQLSGDIADTLEEINNS